MLKNDMCILKIILFNFVFVVEERHINDEILEDGGRL